MHKNEVSFFPHSVITVGQNREAYQRGERISNGITQPSGAAAPRNSDAHEHIAVPQALCVLRERPDQGQKAAKFAVLTPGHAGFPNRAKRSEGSDTTPTRNTTCFAVWAAVCDPVGEGKCVPAATH